MNRNALRGRVMEGTQTASSFEVAFLPHAANQKEHPSMKHVGKHGFTLVEVMIVVAIIALLAAIAIPNVLRGRTTAGESAALGSVHSVVAGLEMYRSVNNIYPAAWTTDMYTSANPDYGPAGFDNLGNVQGYTYTYTQAAAGQQYTLTSDPTNPGTTGSRGFFVNESGRVRHCRCPVSAAAAENCRATVGDNLLDQVPVEC